MSQFARGSRALGICDRCGLQFLLSSLRGEVVKGSPVGNRVCRDCYDPDHPQNFIDQVKTDDNKPLRDPRPDTGLEESRKLS
jgi:hypothetical protein